MRLSGWMMLIIIAVVILAAAGAAVLTTAWLGPVGGVRQAEGVGDPSQRAVASPKDLGPIYNAGIFTVNLSGQGRNTFLRANIAVEVDSRRTLDALQSREPALRDAIIVILRSYTAARLSTPEGVTDLREELREAAEALLPEGEVRQVYFQEFIMQ